MKAEFIHKCTEFLRHIIGNFKIILQHGLKNRTLLLILLLGAIMNIPGILWGIDASGVVFNNVYVGDEGRAYLVWKSIMANSGNPNWAIWPPLYFYISLIWFSIFKGILAPFLYETETYLVSLRTLSLCLFLSSTILVYLIGKGLMVKKYPEKAKIAGYLSAMLFIFTPDIATFSVLAKNEMMLVFFSISSVFFLIRFINTKSRDNFILCSIFTALAISTKYNGIFLLIPIFTAIIPLIKRNGKEFLKTLMFAIFWFLIVIISINIWLIIEWQETLGEALGNLSQVGTDEFVGASGISSTGLCLKFETFIRSMGVVNLILFLLVLFSFIYSIFNKKKRTEFQSTEYPFMFFILGSLIIVFYLQSLTVIRYLAPIWFIVAVLNANFVIRFFIKYNQISIKGMSILPKIMLLSLILSATFCLSISLVKLKDSRVMARHWINENIASWETYAVDDFVDPSRFHYPWGMLHDYRDPSYFDDPLFTYIIVSEITVVGWTQKYVEEYADITQFYELLLNGSGNYELVHTIKSIDTDFNYPSSMEIYYFGFRAILSFIGDPASLWGPDIYIFKRII